MQSANAETRTRVASAGGKGRAATMTPQERADAARLAGAAGHRPAALARRIAERWSDLDEAERAEVLTILADLRTPRRGAS